MIYVNFYMSYINLCLFVYVLPVYVWYYLCCLCESVHVYSDVWLYALVYNI